MKKICLITPGHISSNPRLVKEAVALEQAGYQIHLVFTQNVDYLIPHDFKILADHPKWSYDVLNWAKPNKTRRFKSGLLQKAAKILCKYLFDLSILKLAVNRNYFWQLRKADLSKADLYIAHNLAALPIAVSAAKKNKSKCGFDAEDFHRQETTDDIYSLTYKTIKAIEDKLIPLLDYLTTASPLITSKYLELYPELNPITINNVFSTNFLQKPLANKEEDLKLFWFSQTIGKGRGIEDAIKALASMRKNNINLTLLGNINEDERKYLIKIANEFGLVKDQLIFIPPISSDSIFKLVNKFDIGLALEPGFCLNNNIALSNKIFTYLTSGLAVIASDTPAQRRFIENYPRIGKTYPIGKTKELAMHIDEYNNNRELLYQTKLNSVHLAKEQLNWENESKIFIEVVRKTFIN